MSWRLKSLLGRTPIGLEEQLIRTSIAGRVVMVTGAARSVGFGTFPADRPFSSSPELSSFGIAESPLFESIARCAAHIPTCRFMPRSGACRIGFGLADAVVEYRPTVLYHAAAYKHVPLMEIRVFRGSREQRPGDLQSG